MLNASTQVAYTRPHVPSVRLREALHEPIILRKKIEDWRGARAYVG
jgi:hypothetical protein